MSTSPSSPRSGTPKFWAEFYGISEKQIRRYVRESIEKLGMDPPFSNPDGMHRWWEQLKGSRQINQNLASAISRWRSGKHLMSIAAAPPPAPKTEPFRFVDLDNAIDIDDALRLVRRNWNALSQRLDAAIQAGDTSAQDDLQKKFNEATQSLRQFEKMAPQIAAAQDRWMPREAVETVLAQTLSIVPEIIETELVNSLGEAHREAVRSAMSAAFGGLNERVLGRLQAA